MTQAGWYDDPENPDAHRYWDGQDWTPHRQRKTAATSPPPPATPTPPAQAPPPTQQSQPPGATPGPTTSQSGRLKTGLIVSGLALVVATAVLVTGRVMMGTFLYGLLLIAAIALVSVTFAIRSQRQSRTGKAVFIAAVALVTALAVPLSMQIAYPTYHYFFPSKAAQAAGAPKGAPGGAAPAGGAPKGSSAPDQPPGAPHIPPGILVVNVDQWTFGVVDPDSGTYSEVTKFKSAGTVMVPNVAASPDLTKLAVTSTGAGWVDANGTFTSVTPAADSSAASTYSIGFDSAGNFYYGEEVGHTNLTTTLDIYKVSAGSTSDAQKVQSAVSLQDMKTAWLDYDGAMHFGCSPTQVVSFMAVRWLGPSAIALLADNGVSKAPVSGHDAKGCLTLGQETVLTPDDTFGEFEDVVANHDGSKIAFYAYMSQPSFDGLGTRTPAQPMGSSSIFITDADGSSQPTRLNVPNLPSRFQFLKWD
jgi:hypothetical protein